ncbi:amidohydrolase family protein [Crocinitomicaceae bacterium]|nr:amidohydrolase family protein [Crocinitomicaceae bacterium]
MKKSLLTLSLVLLYSYSFGQAPSKILLLDGFLHIGNGETIERALVGIENGEVRLVKNVLAYSYNEQDWDTIIALNGAHIYPGFVAPNTTLGITEIDQVRASHDFREIGIYNPHIRTQIAYNVESKIISTVRTNGVLIAQPTPRGGSISGSSSVMKLDGWNWEDATISKDDGIHLNWPSSMKSNGWWAEPSPKSANKKYGEQVKELEQFFKMAHAYASGNKVEPQDGRLEAMRACFNGNKRVYFHANELQELQDVISFSETYDIKYPVIVGGYDAHLIARKLSDAKIPVMVVRPHSLPENEEDDVDLPYKLSALLQAGEVKFCIQNAGDMEAMNGRNIPFLAGTAMAYGLTEEEAIRAVSLSSCEILGIDENYGSIEKGKSATLFVSRGNALDMRTNDVTIALIDGEFVMLSNMQKELYEKYSGKYKN